MSESVIHDIGYQRYDGPRLGRAYAARSLYVHGLRNAFGLGRSAKAKIFPWIMVGLVALPAVIAAAVRAQTGEVFLSYQDLPGLVSILTLIFLAVVAPELVSRDLRNKVLPLYFSRPLQRSDYALAKLAALISAVFLMTAGPQTLMFLAAAFGTGDGVAGAAREFRGLLGGYVTTALYAVILSCLALLIASIAGRRAFAAGGIVAVNLVSMPVVAVLMEIGSEKVRQIAPVGSPMMLPEGIRNWFFGRGELEIGDFGPVYGVVGLLLPTICVLLLLLRYRKVSL